MHTIDESNADLSLVPHDVSSPVKSINSEPVMFQGVDLQVVDYYYVGDGASYDKHYYIIEVFVEDIKYTVDRSYVDFVELDRRLRKIYPETNLPNLPLEASAVIEQALIKEAAVLNDVKKTPLGSGQMASTRNSLAFTRESLISSPAFKQGSRRHHYQLLQIPPTSSEVLKENKSSLTLYLVGLTCHHELLAATDMQMFLDPEHPSMLVTSLPPPLSAFDLALLNVETHTTVVSRLEEKVLKVPENHLVMWRFSVENFDIGFQVEVNGKVRLPLTRYRASAQPVCGAIEVSSPSTVKIIWNNTYAKLHSKSVSWSMRMLSRYEYDNFRSQAMDCQNEKFQFQLQREALRRAVIRHAERLSGVIHGAMIEAEHAEMTVNAQRSLQYKLTNALSLCDVHAEELARAEHKVVELQRLKNSLEDSQDLIASSWKQSNTQLDEYQQTIFNLSNELIHLEKSLTAKENEMDQMKEDGEIRLLEQQITRENLERLLFSLRQAVDACRSDHLQGLNLFERREEEYRHMLLDDNPVGVKLENMKGLINVLLGDLINSNRLAKQSMDVMRQIKDGVEQMAVQLGESQERKNALNP